MEQFSQGFQSIDQAGSRAAHQVVIEGDHFSIPDRIEHVPAWPGGHTDRIHTCINISEQDQVRIALQDLSAPSCTQPSPIDAPRLVPPAMVIR